MKRSVEPRPEQIESFVGDAAAGGPVVMINLLRYRERAEYPPGSDAEPCTGREAYARYGAGVTPLLAAHGAKVVWGGRVAGSVIAPEGETWDDAILVEYPSREAFVKMVTSPQYVEVATHRTAALLDSRLIATQGNEAPRE